MWRVIHRSMVTLTGHARSARREVILKAGGKPVGYIGKSKRMGDYWWKLYGFNEKPHSNITSWEEGVARILVELNGGR